MRSDQCIPNTSHAAAVRGLYWPFIDEWRAAFGDDHTLVLRAEQLLDHPQAERPKVLAFLGLPPPPAGSTVHVGPPNYAAMHAASLSSYRYA
jgi:hypothetical protein